MPISSRVLVWYFSMYGIALLRLFKPSDLHSDYQKVAVVVPKMPMEMDRNGDGPVAIGTLDGKRIGTITAGMRLLSSALDGNILQLLGKPVDHPTVKAYMKAHPFYNILPHPERETVIFRTSDERSLNVEELVANVLQEVKKQVSALTGQQVQEVIFPVPASFNQPERRALLEAVEIAGVKARNMSELMMATRRLPESPSWFSDDHLENMDHLLVCTQMMLVVPDVTEPDDCPADVQCVVTVVAEVGYWPVGNLLFEESMRFVFLVLVFVWWWTIGRRLPATVQNGFWMKVFLTVAVAPLTLLVLAVAIPKLVNTVLLCVRGW